MGSHHKPYGHHRCYLAVKIVSNILKKAQGQTFERMSEYNSLTLQLLFPLELLFGIKTQQLDP